MASQSEEQSYSSPPKRIKLDESNIQYKSSVSISEESFSSSFKTSEIAQKSNHSGTSGLLRKSMEESNSIFNLTRDNLNHLPVDGGLEDGDEDDDDVSSTVSNLSDLSGISDLSGQDWKPTAGPMSWVQKQMMNGVNPRTLLVHLMGDSSHVPSDINDLALWKIIINLLSEPPRRTRLRHISTLTDVVNLLKSCSRIIVLTGAGVSVSCGIPDFRSRDGIYSRLAVDFPNLPDPQAMFDITYFRQDPRPFFKFAREIYPGQFKPSPCHRFIKMLERLKKLLRNYTQNIDTLEQVAGIENVIECHGSFATATCTVCSYRVSCDDIRADVFNQKIPYCPLCAGNSGDIGIMKPDIVFFGEGLPESFHSAMAKDKDVCDMLIVIGSSLKVRPVALIPSSIPNNVPQILINRERLPHLNFDVELLGDSDIIIDELCRKLGDEWTEVCWRSKSLTEANSLLSPSSRSSYTSDYCEVNEAMSGDSHMEHDLDEYSRNSCQDGEEIVVCSPGEHLESGDNSCGACRNKSIKCRKIRRIHSRLKSSSHETAASDVEARMSMDQDELDEESDRCLVSRRHLSLDSTRDSGIGDGSNSSHSTERHMSVDSQTYSIASRLPDDSYVFIQPNRYIFPGAEVSDDANDDRSSEIDESESQDQDDWLSRAQLS